MDAIILGGGTPSYVMEALAEGCEALGHRAAFGRQQVAGPDDVIGYDLVCCWGMSSPAAKEVVATCHRLNKPVIIFDLPLLRWMGDGPAWDYGDWVGLYRHHVGQAWDVPCSTARLAQCGIHPMPTAAASPEGGILLLGQVPQDASHDLTLKNYFAWVDEAVATIREADRGVAITWRPHPRASIIPAPMGCDTADCKVSLHEQIHQFAGALTFSSAAQYVCYAEGVPVSVWNRGERWPPPSPQPAVERLAQASWNTWTISEIRNGEALACMLDGPPGPGPMRVIPAQPAKRSHHKKKAAV